MFFGVLNLSEKVRNIQISWEGTEQNWQIWSKEDAEDQCSEAVEEGNTDYWRPGGGLSCVHMAGVESQPIFRH